jgi:hypothetical protein
MCWLTRRTKGDSLGLRGRSIRVQISTPPLAPAGTERGYTPLQFARTDDMRALLRARGGR